jgi:catechol 2,3-dioxygenase-like lactoylglutathione lyase family enzyme
MSSATGRAFSHLALAVGDLDAMAAFYVQGLGFEPGVAYQAAGRRIAGFMDGDPAGFRAVFLRRGDFLLELIEYAKSTVPERRPRDPQEHGFAHIGFVVDDVSTTVADVERAGGTVRARMDHSFVGPAGTELVFVLDLEGNRIELVGHPNESETAAHADYLGLSELGWPAVRPLKPK